MSEICCRGRTERWDMNGVLTTIQVDHKGWKDIFDG